MDTSAIIYRVADFLKAHPPFSAMDEPDLLEFASRGRVRFHEANDYILWQGEPNQFKVFVIQQGTVSLWDERSERAELRDVRGTGDMLGMEQFAGADTFTYSARASTDVLIYAFSAFDFEALVLKYPTPANTSRPTARSPPTTTSSTSVANLRRCSCTNWRGIRRCTPVAPTRASARPR